MRGSLLTKGPDSSFAEAHKGFCSEPIHTEDEVKDQDAGETNEECEERVEERSNTQAHDTWMV